MNYNVQWWGVCVSVQLYVCDLHACEHIVMIVTFSKKIWMADRAGKLSAVSSSFNIARQIFA